MYETPLVRLQPEGDWSADMDAMVAYSPLQPFRSSTWDWIGLYKVSRTLLDKRSNEVKRGSFQPEFQVGFTSALDYITYTWVADNEVAFNEELIQVRVEVNKDSEVQTIRIRAALLHRYILTKMESPCAEESVCCATSAAI